MLTRCMKILFEMCNCMIAVLYILLFKSFIKTRNLYLEDLKVCKYN